MASMDYNFRKEEKIADVASQFNTTVDEIMKLNNVLPPYPKYVRDLPQYVIANGTIELPYVTTGKQTFESYYNSASVALGINYVDAEALEETVLYNASNRYFASTEFSEGNFVPGQFGTDCYIHIHNRNIKKTHFEKGVRLWFPCYPESVSDNNQADYSAQTILGRSEPFQYYTGSGPRSVSVDFQMHSDMCDDITYIYRLTDAIEACCYPEYGDVVSATKVTLHIANNINITGIINNVSTKYSGQILDMQVDPNNNSPLREPKYSMVDLSFSVTEVTGNPPSFTEIANKGGRR